jgi:hypothetical protein
MGSSYQEIIVRKKKNTYTMPAEIRLFAANQSAISPQLFFWGNLKPIHKREVRGQWLAHLLGSLKQLIDIR